MFAKLTIIQSFSTLIHTNIKKFHEYLKEFCNCFFFNELIQEQTNECWVEIEFKIGLKFNLAPIERISALKSTW